MCCHFVDNITVCIKHNLKVYFLCEIVLLITLNPLPFIVFSLSSFHPNMLLT